MLRRSFLKRMALAAAACAFIDVPWPKGTKPERADPDTVFVGWGGDDRNDGLTAQTPVMSMDRAREMLPRGGTIVLVR